MATVFVENISPHTSDTEVKEFFKFCGNISNIHVTPDGDNKTKNATVTFEKETAQRTALLLNNTQLGPNKLSVTSRTETSEEDEHQTGHRDPESDHLDQEDKPRTRILAEYLAQGYVIGDAALERAIELDHKHGVSNRFLSTLQSLDQKYHARDHARTADENLHISDRANGLFSGLSSFFEKASNTPTGQKIVQFYSSGSRQVHHIHAEARRLAELKKQESGGSAYRAAGLEKVFGKQETDTSPEGGELLPLTSPSGQSHTEKTQDKL